MNPLSSYSEGQQSFCSVIKVTLSYFIHHKMTGVTSASSKQARGQQALSHLAALVLLIKCCPRRVLIICRSQGTYSAERRELRNTSTQVSWKVKIQSARKRNSNKMNNKYEFNLCNSSNSSFLCVPHLKFSAHENIFLSTWWLENHR